MATPQANATEDLQHTIEGLKQQLDESRAEHRAALAREAALAEVLDVINRSPGDLGPVFATILEKAHRLCGADQGVLATYDGELFHAIATYGYPPTRQPFRATVPQQALLRGERLFHVPDARAFQWGSEEEETRRAYLERTGARTFLLMPLRRDGTLIGFIGAHRTEVRPFSEREISLLESFAAQAVMAMENARLISEQREALEREIATAEVLQVINVSTGDLTPVFDTMLEKAVHLCEAAFGVLGLWEGDSYRAVAMHNLPEPLADMLWVPRLPSPESSIGRIARGETPIHVIDITTDEPGQAASPMRRAMIDLGGAHTALWVALRKHQTVLGTFAVWRREVRPFSANQIALLENFADHAVIAIENARLLGELRERTDELARRQAELRVTFENMGDGVAMFDATPRLVAWNRKFQDILDLPDRILAERRTFSDYIRYLAERGEYGTDADPEEQINRLTEQRGRYHAFERVRPDGRVIEIRHNPVEGGGFVLIFSDITERKRNEAEIRASRDAAEAASRTIEAAYRDLKAAQANLIQAEKMASLGQLAAGIAHEIKNPLNFVNNFAILSVELLSELKDAIARAVASLDDEQRAEVTEVTGMLTSNLEKITEHGKRADGIVKSMLEHSRGGSAERRTVDINALADEAMNLAYHGARAQDQRFNITLERDFGDAIAPIEVNPQDITRVLLNLFNNGFYAAGRRAESEVGSRFQPTIKVTTRDLGDAVEIRVRDNGTGVPADLKDKLFQPFFTTKPTGEGTGLGLSITYDIVTKAHGGTITVNSEVDEFTEFVVTLPRRVFANEGGRS